MANGYVLFRMSGLIFDTAYNATPTVAAAATAIPIFLLISITILMYPIIDTTILHYK